MFSLLLHVDEDDQDFVIAELWQRGTAGVVQLHETLDAFFDDDADPQELLRDFDAFSPELVSPPETDWIRRTEESFPAQLVGERFFLVPPWNHDPTPPRRMRLEINPGLACGTGWHPCTRMCLEALERTVRPGDRVLVGSGILSVAAGLLGAGLVIGCDIDSEAVWVARERTPSPLFIGSVDAVAASAFDVLVANISAEAARDLFPEFTRAAKVLILSGFQLPPTLPQAPESVTESEGWQCLLFENHRP
jgi:ribosomal protein L11 methylase PrmA